MIGVADKFGFLPGFGWIATQWTSYHWLNSFISVAICWLIAPGSVWGTQYFVQGEPVSLRAQDNFASFYPGDLYLGAMIGFIIGLGMAVLPVQEAWYTNAKLHWSVLSGCIALALVLTWLDVRGVRKTHGSEYPLWQILTPAKLVHNLLLYGPYAYVAIMSIMAVTAGITWSVPVTVSYITAMFLGSVWFMYVLKDSTLATQLRLDKLVGVGKSPEKLAILTLPAPWRPIFMRQRKKARHRAPCHRAARSRSRS